MERSAIPFIENARTCCGTGFRGFIFSIVEKQTLKWLQVSLLLSNNYLHLSLLLKLCYSVLHRPYIFHKNYLEMDYRCKYKMQNFKNSMRKHMRKYTWPYICWWVLDTTPKAWLMKEKILTIWLYWN